MYNIKKKRLKEVSFRNYKNYYEKIILPVYGKMRICDIKPYFIQKFLDKYNAKTPRLCEDLKCLLNGIFEYAVNNGIIDRNPLKAVYIPKHQRKTGTALTPQEEQAFIAAIKGTRFENAYRIKWANAKILVPKAGLSPVRPTRATVHGTVAFLQGKKATFS